MPAHFITYVCPIPAEGEPAVGWVASCTCGATSLAAGHTDGTMVGALRWRGRHLAALPGGSEPVSPPPDEPDGANDSYDQWLRGVTGER